MAEPKRTELMRGVIHPWHHDHFGHMNVRHYAPFFDDACYHIWTRLGIGYEPMIAKYGVHCVTAQATTGFVKELTAGDLIVIDGAVTRVGGKSVTFALRMLNADTGALHATYEVVEVFFDPATRKAAPMPGDVREVLEGWLVAAGEG
jgi:acyl-CoA thioester hydrolase